MSDSVLNDLTAALDLIVLEAIPTGGFRRVEYSHVPEWFFARLHDEGGGGPVPLQQAFPVLDPFLREAEALWAGGTDGRADSEPFVVAGSAGRDVPVIATALAISGRRYLLIQHDASYQARHQVFQAARDRALEHERTLKQLHALRKPIAALVRAADDPALAPESSPAAATIRQHAAALRGLLEELQDPRAGTPKR